MPSQFKLTEKFLEKYKDVRPAWGPVGEVTYYRTYSRTKPDGSNEQWWETVQRVVEGTFSLQKDHCDRLRLPWKQMKATKSAQKMYDKMFNFKFLPPGRGLWMMGTEFIYERGGMALNNCGFASTEDIKYKGATAFAFMMDALMNGVGVGFDTAGAGTLTWKEPKGVYEHVIEDTREGWVESLRALLTAFMEGSKLPVFQYEKIREYGKPIRGFGGIASGPAPLRELHEALTVLLYERVNWDITSADIVDVMNMIGKCVIAGNVRRSAEIALGEPDDIVYRQLKDPVLNKEKLESHRWASNNSIFAKVGMDYEPVVKSIEKNGEPGLVWMDNIQHYGRLIDNGDGPKDYGAKGVNPCGEQSLESFELCCVSGNTRILTQNGYPKIKDVIGRTVKVYNGESWSEVVPFNTGVKTLYRVWISDGSYLDCTSNHEWSIIPYRKRKLRKVYTSELKCGDSVELFSIPDTDGVSDDYAFEWGLFAGDGYLDQKDSEGQYRYPMVIVCGDKAKLKDLDVHGKWYKAQKKEQYANLVHRLNLHGLLDMTIAEELNNKDTGIPDYFFTLDSESIRQFLAGWIETDGSIRKNINNDHFIVFGSEQKMRDLQILIRKIGINHATVSLSSAKGTKTNFGVRSRDLYCLRIPSYESSGIPMRIKKAYRFSDGMKKNNAYNKSRKITYKRRQKIVSVEQLTSENTYCFTEPVHHKGVFGNVLTHQCLVETFPANHDSFEEYKETLKYAYMYAKTVTLVPTHWPETNQVMMKNRRIGTSQSGIVDAFAKFGRRTVLDWCDAGYTYLRDLDTIYSDWFCVPKSIKITSVKPSGTVSLLPGASPGIHYPHAEYYIRRIRIAQDSPLIKILSDSGYNMEPDKRQAKTMVVDFPSNIKHFSRRKRDVTVWEQMVNAIDYQTYWSDNNVSITVTFKDYEKEDVVRVLEAFDDKLKAVSFLPLDDHGYEQAPYEEITKEQYEEMISGLSEPDYSSLVIKATGDQHKYCDSDSCEVEIGGEDEQGRKADVKIRVQKIQEGI